MVGEGYSTGNYLLFHKLFYELKCSFVQNSTYFIEMQQQHACEVN